MNTDRERSRAHLGQTTRQLGWLAAFAIAMGLLEAICVIYLRRLLPIAGSGSSSPIPPLDRLKIEVIREACTMVMLLAVAWLGGFNLRTRAACFFYLFGLWDIVYYAGLKWLADWPGSWLEWDCLFLIPKPWYGPVLAPVLISAYFVIGGWFVYARDSQGIPVRLSPTAFLSQIAAALVWYWSFVKDAGLIGAHGYSSTRYSWDLFVVGLLIATAGLWWAGRSFPAESSAAPVDT